MELATGTLRRAPTYEALIMSGKGNLFFTSGLVGKRVCRMRSGAIKNLNKCYLQRHYNKEHKDRTEGQTIIVVCN
jgi:hypothetical protein